MIDNSEKELSPLAEAMRLHRDDPLKFFRDVLNCTLDKQQAKLVHQACKLGCRVMVKSARGTGKTFVITGLTLYFLANFEDVNIRILSPSEQQLKNVFMRELRKHVQNMNPVYRGFYDIRSMSVKVTDPGLSTNEAHCVTASVERTETASGVHSAKQVYLLDEASAIPDSIYSTVLGSLGTAEGQGHLIGVSNPNRGVGTFYSDLFEKKHEGWKLLTFTAAECKMIEPKFITDMAALYGDDSDEYRVSVLGEFPRADGSVFIPEALVEEAQARHLASYEYSQFPVVLGADISRSLSGDKTVFCVRQGPKLREVIAFNTDDTMETVARLRDTVKEYGVSTVFGDATGVGGPVLDRAREVFREVNLGVPIIDVVSANRSSDPVQYFNVRSQLWGELRSWLTTADLPSHYELKKELSNQTWGYSGKMQIQITSKRNMKGPSSDHADALAYSLYDTNATLRRRTIQPRRIKQSNYLWI